MKFIKSFTLIGAILLFSTFSFAEEQQNEKNKLSLDEGSIDSQFEYVLKKSHNYQEFEVIKKSWMQRLRGHVSDSLELAATKLNASNTKISDQQAEIEAITSQLDATKGELNQISIEKDSMSFFGILVNKNVYNALMWGIVAALTSLLILFIIRFKASIMITKNSKLEYEELNYEFESFRKRALEREQTIKRELQDERNKQLA